MRRKLFYIMLTSVLLFVVVMPSSAQTQNKYASSSIFKADDFVRKPGGFLHKLIDPSKFEMQQSYSLSFMSDGRRSGNLGLYLNTMNFQISDPLMMQVRVGYMHQPLGGNTMMSRQQSGGQVFLQRAMMKYKPTENMSVTLDYQSYPSPMLSPYSYYNR